MSTQAMKKNMSNKGMRKYMKRLTFIQKAWEIVKSQAKQCALYAGLLLFLVPNSQSIYTIMMLVTFMLPIFKGVLEINMRFASVEHPGVDLIIPKILYFLIFIVTCIVCVWKFISN